MKFYLFLFGLLLNACTILPPEFYQQQIIDTPFDQVTADIERYKDAKVRWGGVIVEVDNENNFSLLRVLYYPLDYYGRPDLNQSSEGQFALKSESSLDPEEYAPNREIVVVGSIGGEIEQTIDGSIRYLPLIISKAIHLWPRNYRGEYFGNCPSCYFKQLFW